MARRPPRRPDDRAGPRGAAPPTPAPDVARYGALGQIHSWDVPKVPKKSKPIPVVVTAPASVYRAQQKARAQELATQRRANAAARANAKFATAAKAAGYTPAQIRQAQTQFRHQAQAAAFDAVQQRILARQRDAMLAGLSLRAKQNLMATATPGERTLIRHPLPIAQPHRASAFERAVGLINPIPRYLRTPLAEAAGYGTAGGLSAAEAAYRVAVSRGPHQLAPAATVPLGKIPERGRAATDIYAGLARTTPQLAGLTARGMVAAAQAAERGIEATPGVTKRLGLGLAAPVLQLAAQQSGSPQGRTVAQQVQQAGIAPSSIAEPVGQTLVNLAAFGAGGLYGIPTHPLRTIDDGIAILRGTTQATVGLTAAMLNPEISNAQRGRLINDFAVGTLQALAQEFGPDVTLSQAFKQGQLQPVNAVITLLSIIEPGLKGIELLRYMSTGIGLRAALRLVRDPALAADLGLADATRTLTYRGKEMDPFTVLKTRSRSATGRALESGLDIATGTRLTHNIPLIGQTRRAARTMKDLEHRKVMRLRAEGATLISGVESYLKAVDPNDELGYAARLFYIHQKPADIPDETWLRALKGNLEEMLAGRAVQHPGLGKGAKELQLERRVASFSRKVDALERRHVFEQQAKLQMSQLLQSRDLRDAQRHRALVEADTTLTAEEKAAQLQDIDAGIAAIQSNLKAVGTDLRSISADQTPVESAARDELYAVVDQLPNVSTDSRQALFQILDSRARAWGEVNGLDSGEFYSNPDGLGLAEIHMIEHNAELPDGALAQVRFNLQRGPTAEQVTENLRYVEGGDLYNPARGVQKNRKYFRTVNGQRVQVIGKITPAEWVKRVLAVVPDFATRNELARWYENVTPIFQQFFGDNPDAEALLRGFATSQANASPTSGLGATLRVMDKIKAGIPIADDEISAVVLSIEQAVKGEHVSKGLAAKLHDFADSIEGKRTRTWMGDDPRGGAPTANDIHAIRDLGYVEPKIIGRLLNPEPGALFKRGFKKGDFVRDSASSASTHQYERMRELYGEITDHLNEIGFDGRHDWKPAEAQALGWSAIQMLHGATPEDLIAAVRGNTRRINLELHGLTMEQGQAVARNIGPAIHEMVNQTEGLTMNGVVDYGVSARGGVPTASVQFSVIGSPEAVNAFRARLGRTFENDFRATATRTSSSTGSKPTITIYHPDLANPETAVALYNELHALVPKRFQNFISVVDDGKPGIALHMPGKAVTESTHAARADEFTQQIAAAVDKVLSDGEAEPRLTNTQIFDKEPSETLPSLARTRSKRALADPAGAEARSRLEQALAGADQAGAEPPRVLAQTRQNDLLGAVSYLNSEDGSRILYLTQHADASTLLHELIGHSTRELAAHYPDEWAAVEAVVGKPLAEWDVAEHEWLARNAERYFASGIPPTPELTVPFRQLKREMRTLYGGLRAISPEPIPPAVSRLFDSYFGAYDDANVTRVAAWTNGDIQIERMRGRLEGASQDLARLRRAKETRAFNQSLEGKHAQIQTLLAKDVLSPAEEEELAALNAEMNMIGAEREQNLVDRETGLRQRIAEIEKALAAPDSRRYQGAVASLQALTDIRQQIMDSVFGDMADVFTQRGDLMADWLVEQGFLKPDFERGTARYVSHWSAALTEHGGGKQARAIDRPNAPLVEGQSIGPTSRANLNLHHRNNLYRWQNGDLHADPMVIFADWQNAMSFAYIHGLKERMAALGRKLGPTETIPEGVRVINLKGTPIPEMNRRAHAPVETDAVQKVLDSIDGHDPAVTQELLADYVKDIFMEPARADAYRRDAAAYEFYVVDEQLVNALFRPLKSAASTGGEVLDFANSLARTAMIYSNPTYIPINFLANAVFLFGGAGVSGLYNISRVARIAAKDEEMFNLILAESGEMGGLAIRQFGRHRRAEKPIRRGARYFEQDIERRLATFQTRHADQLPRAAAWLTEARKLHYRTREEQIGLLRGTSARAIRDRQTISDRANNLMVNFERMGDWERQNIARVLFIWPWMRGATAWPFHYMKEYPVRSAVISNIAEPAERRRQRLLGKDVRPAYRGLFPVEARGGRGAQVINVTQLSPTDTAAGLIESARNLVMWSLPGGPDQLEIGSRVLDYLNPAYQLAFELVAGVGSFGESKPLGDLLYDNAASFIPQGSLIQQLLDPSKASKAFRRRDAWALIGRRFGRIRPEDVDVINLQAGQQNAGRKTISQQTQETVDALHKQIHDLGGSSQLPIPQSVRRAINLQHIWEEAQHEQKVRIKRSGDWQKSSTSQKEPKLTELQKAWIAYQMYVRYAPGAKGSGLTTPDHLAGGDDALIAYTNALLYGNKTYDIPGLIEPLDAYRQELSNLKREAKAS